MPAPDSPPTPPKPKSIMRSLGEFFGHIAHGVRTDPAKPAAIPQPTRTVTRQTVEEEHRDTPQGKITLRRTVIEEVELPPQAAPSEDAPSADHQ